MPECSSPKWPRYGCRFCQTAYRSRALLNRHHDHYLHEYVKAFRLKKVKTTLLQCHPLEIMRAIRCKSGRHPGEDRPAPRRIKWDDVTFTAFDDDLDLAVKLYNEDEVDVFKRRALTPAAEWVAKLGYIHSPRKVMTAKTTIPKAPSVTEEDPISSEEYDGSSDNDQTSSEDDDPDTVQNENNTGSSQDPAVTSQANNHDNIIEALGANKFGNISRRLFSNVGANKQLAAGSGSHNVSSKDTVSINCISKDKYELVTPPRKTTEQLPGLRRRTTKENAAPGLFQDSDNDNDVEDRIDFNTPTTKGLKGKGKEAPMHMERSVANRESNQRHKRVQNLVEDQLPASEDDDENTGVAYTRCSSDAGSSASVPNIKQNGRYAEEAILISSDASDQEDDDEIFAGGDNLNDDADDVAHSQGKPKDQSHVAPSPSDNASSKRSRNESVPKETPRPHLIATSIRHKHPRMAAPYVTPRTRSAQFFTPGNDVPVVLWLNIMLYAGHAKFAVAVRLGCSRTRAVEQVREQLRQRGVGNDWPELEGLELLESPGSCISDAQWAELMANGGSKDVALLWKL